MRVPGVERDPQRGKRIKATREAKHLTQPDLAAAVGVSKRTIWEWEKGGPLNRPNLRALAEELGVSADYLLTGEGGKAAGPDPLLARIDEVLVRLSRLEVSLSDRLATLEQKLEPVPVDEQSDAWRAASRAAAAAVQEYERQHPRSAPAHDAQN